MRHFHSMNRPRILSFVGGNQGLLFLRQAAPEQYQSSCRFLHGDLLQIHVARMGIDDAWKFIYGCVKTGATALACGAQKIRALIIVFR